MCVHVNSDDVAGVDVEHHVRVEVGAFDRPGELGDVPGVDLPWRGGHQLRACFGRVPRLSTSRVSDGLCKRSTVS